MSSIVGNRKLCAAAPIHSWLFAHHCLQSAAAAAVVDEHRSTEGSYRTRTKCYCLEEQVTEVSAVVVAAVFIAAAAAASLRLLVN